MESFSQNNVEKTTLIDRNSDDTKRHDINSLGDDTSTCTKCSTSESSPLHRGTRETSSGMEETKALHRNNSTTPDDPRQVQNQGPLLSFDFDSSPTPHAQRMDTDSPTVALPPFHSTTPTRLTPEGSISTNPSHFMRGMLSELRQVNRCPSRIRPLSSSSSSPSPSPTPTNTTQFMRGMLSELQKSDPSPGITQNHASPFGLVPFSEPTISPASGKTDEGVSFLSVLTVPSSDVTMDSDATMSSCSRTPARSSRSLPSRGSGRLLPFASTNREPTAKRDHDPTVNCLSPLSTEDSEWSMYFRRKRARSQSVFVQDELGSGDDLSRAGNPWKRTDVATESPSQELLTSKPSTAMEEEPMNKICRGTAAASIVSPKYPSSQKSRMTATTQQLSVSSAEYSQSNNLIATNVPKATNTSISFVALRRISTSNNQGSHDNEMGQQHVSYESSQESSRAGKSLFSRNDSS